MGYQPRGPPRPNPQFGAGGGPVGGARAWVSTDHTRRPPETLPRYGSLTAFYNSSVRISDESKILPIKRPDRGGTLAVKSVRLLANHFPVSFDPETTIMHYDVDIKPEISSKSRFVKKPIPKGDLRLIMEKLFSDSSNKSSMLMFAYDGEKNIFSAETLPTGKFDVELSDGEGTKSRSYTFTTKLVNELKLSKLRDYSIGNLIHIPRDILQFMDLGINGVNDFRKFRRQVTDVLRGRKVTVIHGVTNQMYTVAGLTDQNTPDLSFILEYIDGKKPPREVGLVNYFRKKYGQEIMYKDLPCLDLGKNKRKNYVPMEFCILVEGQRYHKEQLDRNSSLSLKKISLAPPRERKNAICEMLKAEDGPFVILLRRNSNTSSTCITTLIELSLDRNSFPFVSFSVLIHDSFAYSGDVIPSFGIGVNENMTQIVSRVIAPPDLKLGTPAGNMNVVRVDKDKCQWNLVGRSVVEGRPIDRWAFIDFSSFLNPENFIRSLRARLKNLGIRIEEPLVRRFTNMYEFSGIDRLRRLLEGMIEEASKKSQGRLQVIVCVMAAKHHGYNYLKWVSETQIGVLTQCCLSSHASKANDQYLANLGLKLNAKLGGSNAELIERLPRFEGEDHVMFIGADVNHTASRNTTYPSIAAVVATVNWPAANRYAARICPQDHRKEKMMYLDLINTYARFNKVKPKNIVVFCDGVSEGQFDMVLNEELLDLKNAIYEEHYRPKITLVVAQKRHQTRLFLENERDGGSSGNVPPGTVLQKLTYNLCFTFARCTPPVYYADLAKYRGRMFQEELMELQSPASASSASSSSVTSSSSSAASFDERFYKLHPELQDMMFSSETSLFTGESAQTQVKPPFLCSPVKEFVRESNGF
ncbi:hypothetical protein RJ639_006202 [Escallonia herrerae]|uniref:Argonaute 2 n=1 Tax=Escallonia herrerae TaxID=1293975 RepID=A0AA89AY53_9ASTE|nr:hypothetical protein RJ639_006202 [Escallonia herrerae]